MAHSRSHGYGHKLNQHGPHDFSLIETFFKVCTLRKDLYFTSTLITLSYAQVNAPLQFGEEVRVCGNVPNLGCGDPSRAVPLYTTPRDYPTWSSRDGKSVYGRLELDPTTNICILYLQVYFSPLRLYHR